MRHQVSHFIMERGFVNLCAMRRILVMSAQDRELLSLRSQSLASRRHLPSHAKVRSTTYRLGRRVKPLAPCGRLTISSTHSLPSASRSFSTANSFSKRKPLGQESGVQNLRLCWNKSVRMTSWLLHRWIGWPNQRSNCWASPRHRSKKPSPSSAFLTNWIE